MTIHFHENDLPAGALTGPAIAVDTETMGLNPHRDRLCLVQLSAGDGDAHLVRLAPGCYDAPNLKALLADPAVLKIYHFARFDLAVLHHYLGVMATPVYCTKVASKLIRTFTDRHGLKDLAKDLLGIDLSKQQQSSDWGAEEISEAQRSYAAADVLHLHALKVELDRRLEREGRVALAQACFDFLPTRAVLDLLGYTEPDILDHRG
ncbi:MAG: ribonuclease D [Pseudomonadota bacterium]